MFGSRIKEPVDIAADSLVNLGEVTQISDPATQAEGKVNANPEQNQQLAYAYPVQLEPVNSTTYRPAVIDAADTIKFAAMFIKDQYNNKHKSMFFNVSNFVALRLHRGYNVTGIKGNTKILQQFAGPFKILKRIGKLAYRVELPPGIKIHPVISVAHLEPYPDPAKDPYQRPYAQGIVLDPVPEKLLNRRTQRRRNRGEIVEYLVRFSGRPVEYDQ